MKKYAKIEDKNLMTVSVGLGTDSIYYESIGMIEMDVEFGYDGNWYVKGYAPKKPKEQIEAETLAQAKADRANAVSKITVWVDGMEFDGDEESQQRLSRVVSIASTLGVDIDNTYQTWVLANNTIAQVTIRQLARACELAGKKQTELWTKPYESETTE